jgi:uncharacterized protein (DUF488 family)
MACLHTIGHSNHPIESFVRLLTGAGVDLVVDVRTVPHSRRFPQFSKKALDRALGEAGIGYRWMGDTLGGLKHRSDSATFEQVAASPAFADALDTLVSLAQTHAPAIMCAEREPMDCHRTILVGRHLRERDVTLRHILGDGTIESNADFEARLVRKTRVSTDTTGQLFGETPAPADPAAAAYAERAARMARDAAR